MSDAGFDEYFTNETGEILEHKFLDYIINGLNSESSIPEHERISIRPELDPTEITTVRDVLCNRGYRRPTKHFEFVDIAKIICVQCKKVFKTLFMTLVTFHRQPRRIY